MFKVNNKNNSTTSLTGSEIMGTIVLDGRINFFTTSYLMDYKLLYLHGNKLNQKKQTPKKATNKNKKGYNQLPDCSINLKHLRNSGMFTWDR